MHQRNEIKKQHCAKQVYIKRKKEKILNYHLLYTIIVILKSNYYL